MELENFQKYSFTEVIPTPIGEVYVICFVKDGREIPFYIGQTGRFEERMGDYQYAQFGAATDFKVGEAIKYLRSKGFDIIVRHRLSSDRLNEEKQLIQEATRVGITLLNACPGYNYKTAIQDDARKKVQDFCDLKLLSTESHP